MAEAATDLNPSKGHMPPPNHRGNKRTKPGGAGGTGGRGNGGGGGSGGNGGRGGHPGHHITGPGGMNGNGLSLNHTLNRNDLKAVLRQQVEFYLSRENLAHDTYLRNMMDAQNTVPLAEIVRFRKMIQICDDPALLKELVPEAIADSSVCSITPEGGLRPLIKSERNTIILRDIASVTPPERVREIFSIPDGKTVKSIRSDVGDTWFVTMESEADAVSTMLAIRNQHITFNGAPIKARLKSEVGSFLGHSSSPRNTVAGRGSHGGQQMAHRGLGGVHGGYPMASMPPPMGHHHHMPYMTPHMNGQGGYGPGYAPGGGYSGHQRRMNQHSHRQMPPYGYTPNSMGRPLPVAPVRQGNARGVNIRSSDGPQGKGHPKKGAHGVPHNTSAHAPVKASGNDVAPSTAAGKKKKNKAKKESSLNGAESINTGPGSASGSDTQKAAKESRKQNGKDGVVNHNVAKLSPTKGGTTSAPGEVGVLATSGENGSNKKSAGSSSDIALSEASRNAASENISEPADDRTKSTGSRKGRFLLQKIYQFYAFLDY